MSSSSTSSTAARRVRSADQRRGRPCGPSWPGARDVLLRASTPPRPACTLGNLVPLMAMAHLARAGHRPIAVLGGRHHHGRRPQRQDRAAADDDSAETDRRQPPGHRAAGPALAGGGGAGQRGAIVDNADWLLPLNYIEFLRDIGRHFSVNRMLAAEAYKQRLEKGLSFIEFNYQLLQAYDFLVLNRRHGCALQIGGDDQWGNILAGTDLDPAGRPEGGLRADVPAAGHGHAARRWARPPRGRCGCRPS